MIDTILCDVIKTNVKSENSVALLLSGGVDSISVGFALHRLGLGIKIHAYSFRLDTQNNYDFNKAKEISEIMNFEFTGVVINTSNLVQDFHKLVSLGAKKKTNFEATYPFLHVFPKIKESYVATGWAADGYYGLSKKANIHFKHTKELFDKFRDNYFLPENCASYSFLKKVSDMHNKKLIAPYLDSKVKDYFYTMDWDELNKPYQKHHVRKAFEKEFNMIGKVNKHLNLQLESKVDKLFETLIDNKEINFKNRQRVMDICRDHYLLNNTNTLENFFE